MSNLHEGHNTDIPSHEESYVWRKSSRSMSGGHCVEVAGTRRSVRVRDSRVAGPLLELSTGTWASFIEQIKDGR